MDGNNCEVQQERLSKFFNINYDIGLEHEEQKKLNILKEPREDLCKDLIFNLSQSAKYNFINNIYPTRNMVNNTSEKLVDGNSKLRRICRRNAIRLVNESIKTRKLHHSVHFQDTENADTMCSASGTIVRRLELKKEEKEIPQFQVLLEQIVKERDIQNAKGSSQDSWSFQESSDKTGETKYFYDIEETTSNSLDFIQDSNDYIMSSLYLDSLNSYVEREVAETDDSKVSEAQGKIYKHHKVRFWLNHSEIKLLSHTGR